MLTAAPSTAGSTAAPRAMGVNLVLFFVFALCALVMLTSTLVSVSQVQVSVRDAVRPATSGIAHDTNLLPKLTRTNHLAGRMSRAGRDVNASLTSVGATTQRLAGQLGEVRSGTDRIDSSVTGITDSSSEVRRRVAGLGAKVAVTDRTTAQLAPRLAAADQAVGTLRGSLHDARVSLDALFSLIPSISGQAGAISRTLGAVDAHVTAISSNGLVRLANLLQLHNLLSGLRLDGGR